MTEHQLSKANRLKDERDDIQNLINFLVDHQNGYCFGMEIEVFYKYKSCRESHIKEIAQKAYNNNEILLPVFNALMKYNIDITD